MRNNSTFLTDPYRQCKFPGASGRFLIDNLMRGLSWQVGGVSFQPAQARSAGPCLEASPIGVFRKKSQGQLKLLPFPVICNFFSFLKRLQNLWECKLCKHLRRSPQPTVSVQNILFFSILIVIVACYNVPLIRTFRRLDVSPTGFTRFKNSKSQQVILNMKNAICQTTYTSA